MRTGRTDEELQIERKEARKKDEDASIRDVSLLSRLSINQLHPPPTNRGSVVTSLGSVSGFRF